MSEEAPRTQEAAATRAHGGLLPFLLDFGPLLIFFVVFKLTDAGGAFGALKPAIYGTIAFMVAITVAIAISYAKFRRVSPMSWLSAVLVLFFGALTVYFRSETFIQVKPTIIYTFFGVLLIGGWLRGKSLLRYVFQAAYDGLDDTGWLKLARNWGAFFLALAIANEVMRAVLDFETWLTIKVWGITIVSMVFAVAQVPMLMRHGLDLEAGESETPAAK